MPQEVTRKQEIIDEFRRHEDDSGSPEVQIALLTDRIEDLTDHMEEHPQDHDSRRGLLQLVSKRDSLLEYLRENDEERYKTVVEKLDL
ncbi:MAG: 30S ribosomal protein S15 [bacterium]